MYDEGKTKEEKQTPEETLTKSPSIIVGQNFTMQETFNAPYKIFSKNMKKHSGRRKKEIMGISLLMKE